MWTPDALRSEARPYSQDVWRVVEGQAYISTLGLVDNLQEQQILEEEIETVKPTLPPGTERLHPLLRTPFRYEPTAHGSRFRRAHQRDGVYYGSERVETAVAELSFYRLLFLAEAPGMQRPQTVLDLTAFCVACTTRQMIDLSQTPFCEQAEAWRSLTEVEVCQTFADIARVAQIEALRYASVRDPDRRGSTPRANIALLTWTPFKTTSPKHVQTWHMFLRADCVEATCEHPQRALSFSITDFADDPRLAPLLVPL